jgi:hypothetical protein
MVAVFWVSVLLSSDEWVRIQQAANRQFPNETLSLSEIVRRYTLAGIEVLTDIYDEDRKRLGHQCVGRAVET